MSKKISEDRKAAYYIGGLMMILGGLLFASTFVTFAMKFGDFSNFEADAKSNAFRALAGMALLIIGGMVRGVGARGLAGSGVVLDPEQARSDLEPYSRAAGGMLKDALDEADVDLGRGGAEPEKVIMIKCPACGTLNTEDANFCKECGHKF